MDTYDLNKETFDKLAAEYESHFMNYKGYHDTFDLFIEAINSEKARLLDVACGPGNVSKYLLSKRSQYQILGTDIAPNMIALAQKNNPTAHYELLDARNLIQLDHRFDAIICAFGLPYLNKLDAVQLIEDCSELLIENGILYLSTMEGEYSNSEYVSTKKYDNKTFVYYHEAKSLIEALYQNNFVLLHEKRKPYQNEEGKEFVDLFLIAKKEIDKGS